MPRSIGYNVIGWNEAPWAKSGYYSVSDTQDAAFDIRQYVADSQVASYDVTNAVTKSADVAYDVSPLSRLGGNAVLARLSGHGNLTRKGGNAALVRLP